MLQRVCFFILLLVCLISCGVQQDDTLVDRLIDLEGPAPQSKEVSEETVTAIRESIRLYEDRIAADLRHDTQLVQLYKRLARQYIELGSINNRIGELSIEGFNQKPDPADARYYKILAIKRMDNQLYGKAYEALQKAIELDAGNEILFYLSGVSAGWLAKAQVEPAQRADRQEWLEIARGQYERAIEIKPTYVEALYGLAVLLVFELDGPLTQADALVQRILAVEKYNTEAMFLAAIIYDEQGRYREAIEQYENILAVSGDEDVKERARSLENFVKEKLYAEE